MIIGPDFAIGHISRTGGDAMRAYFRALNMPNVYIQSEENNAKHDPFHSRPDASGKKLYVVMIRKLDEWALSQMNALYLEESGKWRNSWIKSGCIKQREDLLNPECFLNIPYADLALAGKNGMLKGVHVTRWLRTEHLLEDAQSLALDLGVSKNKVVSLASVKTKPRLALDPNMQLFSKEQKKKLYTINPVWATIETLANFPYARTA